VKISSTNYGIPLVLLWGGWYEASKLLGGFMGAQEARSESAGKKQRN
jgi:hypothetical protein